ncbi:MAG: hypothetical protein ACR2PK_17430 [Acidimicrobiales bacterium]
MKTLSDEFLAAGTDTINHRGRIVKAIVRIPVRDGATVRIIRKLVSPDRPQGLKLGLNRGVLDVNGVRAPAITLWSNTSPDHVELSVRGDQAKTLELWNCWSMGGVDTSWVGNAGIVTKTTATGMVIRCSDGIGQPDFSDLEAEIVVER